MLARKRRSGSWVIVVSLVAAGSLITGVVVVAVGAVARAHLVVMVV